MDSTVMYVITPMTVILLAFMIFMGAITPSCCPPIRECCLSSLQEELVDIPLVCYENILLNIEAICD